MAFYVIMESLELDSGGMNSMARVKTGIEEFDELICGGFPKGSFIVVTGGPGTGKSIFASQFLANGIMKYNERCLYISSEQKREEIISQARQFGWNFEQFEKDGKLKIVTLIHQRLFENKQIEEIKYLLEEQHFDRVILDSITSFIYSTVSPSAIADGAERGITANAFIQMGRANASSLIDMIKNMGITTIGISQKIEGLPGETVDNVSEFKGDGLVVLNTAAIGKNLNRTIQVKKLRKTKIDGIPHNFDFTENGINFL